MTIIAYNLYYRKILQIPSCPGHGKVSGETTLSTGSTVAQISSTPADQKSWKKRDNFISVAHYVILIQAEERFWVNYVHDDGSFLKPLRSRLNSRASSIVSTSTPRTRNTSTQSEASFATSAGRTRNSSSGSLSDQASFASQRSPQALLQSDGAE